LEWIESLLAQANLSLSELEAIAVGVGPGAFTGIRIGVGVSQGLAYGANLPCVPVICLDAVALEGIQQLALKNGDELLVAVDARMSEIYWANYQVGEDGLPKALSEIYLTSPKEIKNLSSTFYLVGNAADVYLEELAKLKSDAQGFFLDALPHALSIATLAFKELENGRKVDPEDLLPIYVRDKVAQTIAERAASK
jgi:tRNA threonylcarbamoyladenosine biosynthesis protein TsaB